MPIVNKVAWRIGGQQGEGIDSTGEIFAKACARYGLHMYTYRSFGSRIRGGLTFYEVRVSETPVASRPDTTDIIVALGQDVVDSALEVLTDNAVIIYDSDAFELELSEEDQKRFYTLPLPMTSIAQENGSKIMRNMVSLGATAKIIGMDIQAFYDFVEERFSKKGQKIVDMNRGVIKSGWDYVEQNVPAERMRWSMERRPLPNNQRRLVLKGTDAASFGALAGGCRFVAGYPITPATDVLEWITEHTDEYGGVAIQVEDELSAINMTLGAAYTGVRAMTSTSGPGLSLMTEGIGLSGMAEIPIVVFDVMRPGPSTGLPTKHGQTDLYFALHGGHDEFPRIILSPSDHEEAFQLAKEAFNFAEEYQCPVFYLLDQDLGIAFVTMDDIDIDKVPVRRGKLVKPEDIADLPPESFKRFELTDDGISPRSIPGMKGGLYLSAGSESGETGVITENKQNRVLMMQKRAKKLDTFYKKHLAPSQYGKNPVLPWLEFGDEDAKVGVITWGSTRHPVEEALARFREEDGIPVKHMVITHIWPFPDEKVKAFIDSCDEVVFVEANGSGQLAEVTKMRVGGHDKIEKILKYDGTPFRANEIHERLQDLVTARKEGKNIEAEKVV